MNPIILPGNINIELTTEILQLCNQNNNNNIKDNIIRRDYCVYILESLKNGKTYVGKTYDIYIRLRQHNGEISGGAKKTEKHRPWRIICYVSGVPDSVTALQFEWVNIHPKMMGLKFRYSIKGRIQTMTESLTYKPKFTSPCKYYTKDLQLTWNWKVSGYSLSDFNFYMPNVKEIMNS